MTTTTTIRTSALATAMDKVRSAPRIAVAMRAAEVATAVAARAQDPRHDAQLLADLVDDRDAVVALAALHALGAIADPLADETLVRVLARGRAPFDAHAAWALAGRRPSVVAARLLVDLMGRGGFAGMIAERTAVEWARAGSRDTLDILRRALVAADEAGDASAVAQLRSALAMVPGSAVSVRGTKRTHLADRRVGHQGVVVVQPFLHARLDRDGTSLGSGDAGGIASLLRSLGGSLAGLDDIDEVITITRAHGVVPADGSLRRPDREASSAFLGPNHRIERIAFGGDSPLPLRETWQYRTLLEREFLEIGRQLRGRRVVWHLRMADVGTLAAAAAARRLGQTVVFTVAPDPHVVIDALESDGRLDRAGFGMADAAAQYWFRARMVERLSAQVDALVLLPRPAIQSELVELVGLDPADLASRSTVVAEGVDVGEIDRALERSDASDRPAPTVAAILERIPEARRHLPWMLAIGRLNPLKGPHRFVGAVAGAPDLHDRFNIVLIGGDVDAPSADERTTLDLVADAARPLPSGALTVVAHVPPASIADALVHAARHGGIYVCASDKEEFGLAIVEALAAGLTVVAPQRGGPSTYVTDDANGALCDTSSVDAIRAAIRRVVPLAGDEVRAAQSRADVREHLSIDRMATALSAVYTALVAADEVAAA